MLKSVVFVNRSGLVRIVNGQFSMLLHKPSGGCFPTSIIFKSEEHSVVAETFSLESFREVEDTIGIRISNSSKRPNDLKFLTS
jgi:hypothetical protein